MRTNVFAVQTALTQPHTKATHLTWQVASPAVVCVCVGRVAGWLSTLVLLSGEEGLSSNKGCSATH